MFLSAAETSGVDATTGADSLFVLTFASRDGVSQAGAQPVRRVSRVFGEDCEESARWKKSSLTACGKGRPSSEHAQVVGATLGIALGLYLQNGGAWDGVILQGV